MKFHLKADCVFAAKDMHDAIMKLGMLFMGIQLGDEEFPAIPRGQITVAPVEENENGG